MVTASSSDEARAAASAVSSSSAVKPKAIPPYATLAFGAVSGLASCVLLQPFDLLKTRLQQLDHTRPASSPIAAPQYASRTAKLVAITKDIVRTHGYQGLWRGTTPTVIRNVPGVALYFYSVSHLRHVASQRQIPYISVAVNSSDGAVGSSTLAKLSTMGNLLTGAVARVTVGFILSPVTVVKARFESSNFSAATERTLLSSMREIHAQSGFRGFFQGFTATALRDAPYAGLYLALYEACKTNLSALSQSVDGGLGTGNWMVVSGSGLLAGTLATLLTHPFDIIKTRMQTTPPDILHHIALSHNPSPISSAAAIDALRKPSVWGMTKHLWATSGPAALLDGLGLRCARKAASSAIGWSIFEGGRSWYTEREARRTAAQGIAVGRALDHKQV
ncbi:related to Graves disease carrier protein [Sporisorium reilianum f. sp. reilianum]|uniref:Mitochondrial glycine transporter n=1 Tax=Sporisorium reilianum f. sp. reilianum TaxID=72559 RepID=A0A2N8UAP6_9BASI|nr:related to Graves disease carrier protein [Sporisorium reilianum f. sp. reilianum]